MTVEDYINLKYIEDRTYADEVVGAKFQLKSNPIKIQVEKLDEEHDGVGHLYYVEITDKKVLTTPPEIKYEIKAVNYNKGEISELKNSKEN